MGRARRTIDQVLDAYAQKHRLEQPIAEITTAIAASVILDDKNEIAFDGRDLPGTYGRLFAARSARELGTGIHIAKRPDGETGTGSADDPFDGSDAETLDSLLVALSGLENQKPIFHEGSFETTFNWGPLAGWTIQGAEKGLTTLLNVGTPENSCIRGQIGDENITIQDLTIDVNGSGKAATIGGVQLGGSGCIIRRVRVTRAINSTTAEGFPLAIFGTGVTIENCLIEDCEVDNFLVAPTSTKGGTMICISTNANAYPSAYNVVNCTIRNNNVHDCEAQAYGGFGNGVDCLMENNRADNCPTGLFGDSWDSTRCIYRGNTFTNMEQFGIVMNTEGHGVISDMLIEDNQVVLNAGPDRLGVWIEATNAAIDCLELRNNRVYLKGRTQSGANQWGYNLNVSNSLIATNNRCDAVLRNTFACASGTLVLKDNRSNDGGKMYYSSASTSPRVAVHDTHGIIGTASFNGDFASTKVTKGIVRSMTNPSNGYFVLTLDGNQPDAHYSAVATAWHDEFLWSVVVQRAVDFCYVTFLTDEGAVNPDEMNVQISRLEV